VCPVVILVIGRLKMTLIVEAEIWMLFHDKLAWWIVPEGKRGRDALGTNDHFPRYQYAVKPDDDHHADKIDDVRE
jgi:hypothetical protein